MGDTQPVRVTDTAQDTTASALAVDTLIAAVLCGDSVQSDQFARHDSDTFITAVLNHDVLPLVAERLVGHPAVPESLRAVLRDRASQAVAADLLRESEIRRLLAALAARSIGALIIKGSHLAYSHYPRPDLRPRVDTDLLVESEQRHAVHEILTAQLGYEAVSKVSGDFVAAQRLYVRYHDAAFVHAVDVHWKVSSPAVFSHITTYEEMVPTAVPLPSLGPGARGPADLLALLIACVHRVAHHDDSPRFKWLYDIHLIARRFTPADWRRFEALAAERRVSAVCLRSLQRAAYWFRTDVPVELWQTPRHASPRAELSAAYLKARPKARMVADDLRALPSWRDRGRLLFEHLCPSADYMRRVYAPRSHAPLAVLYLLRIARGARRWLIQSHRIPQ